MPGSGGEAAPAPLRKSSGPAPHGEVGVGAGPCRSLRVTVPYLGFVQQAAAGWGGGLRQSGDPARWVLRAGAGSAGRPQLGRPCDGLSLPPPISSVVSSIPALGRGLGLVRRKTRRLLCC